MDRVYACIDLKSFFASVECRERNLDPLTTNLVVADSSRTEKTICLAVTPSLKAYGLSGRSRLYEVIEKVKQVNKDRLKYVKSFTGKSFNSIELKDKNLELDFIIAKPRMSYYIKYSNMIYDVYLKYISKDDMYVYSIDEVFIDLTDYLKYYKLSPKELITKIIKDVYLKTGITATAGVGSNMFLAKIAMDITAKHMEPNDFGVRYAELDEKSYRETLWNHEPLTDFWRIGKGISTKLNNIGIYTMGDLCRYSLKNEDRLYKIFGVNAELIIDHAWGYEPATIKSIKSVKPKSKSLSTGQVLHEAYDYNKTKIIIKEMIDLLSLELVDKNYVTNQLVLVIGYDIDNLTNPNYSKYYNGDVEYDHYGRMIPKHAQGTINLKYKTNSYSVLLKYIIELYDEIINKKLVIRRINIIANNIENKDFIKENKVYEQFNLFDNNEKKDLEIEHEINSLDSENKLQHTILDLKRKYGKNSILRGMNYLEGATSRDRNKQIGGHSE